MQWRLSNNVLLVGLCCGLLLDGSRAFIVHNKFALQESSTALCMTKKGKGSKKNQNTNNEKSKLTSTDIINRARAKVGLPVDEPEEPLYDEDLLDDMKECLLKLEKRVKDGPGALNQDEVLEFESAMERIVSDMNDRLVKGDDRKATKTSANSAPPSTPVTGTSPVKKKGELKPTHNPAPLYDDSDFAYTKPAVANVAPTSPVFEAPGKTEAHDLVDKVFQNPKPKKIIDTSNDEGPAYEGKGGLGIAKDTRSTYVIPGMDEMDPEEYRAALQKSVSERQARRRQMGVVGNQASGNYLDNLNNS